MIYLISVSFNDDTEQEQSEFNDIVDKLGWVRFDDNLYQFHDPVSITLAMIDIQQTYPTRITAAIKSALILATTTTSDLTQIWR